MHRKCSICQVQKRNNMFRNKTTCFDCFNAYKPKAETLTSKLNLREVELNGREFGLNQREKELNERKEVVKKREQIVDEREQVIDEREKELHTAKVLTQKQSKSLRKKEEKLKKKKTNLWIPKRRPFEKVGIRRKQVVVTQLLNIIKVHSGGCVGPCLQALFKRHFGEVKDSESKVEMYETNIKNFAERYLQNLPDRSRVAATLTDGLVLRQAELLTKVPDSSISWARHEIEKEKFFSQTILEL